MNEALSEAIKRIGSAISSRRPKRLRAPCTKRKIKYAKERISSWMNVRILVPRKAILRNKAAGVFRASRRKPETREKRMKEIIEMLARGEKFH